MKTIKILSAILILAALLYAVFAIVDHAASQVFPGIFSERFSFRDGGVGIGTASPDAMINVQGNRIVAVYKKNCPEGFIPVPHDNIHTFEDFCVMKYTLKNKRFTFSFPLCGIKCVIYLLKGIQFMQVKIQSFSYFIISYVKCKGFICP